MRKILPESGGKKLYWLIKRTDTDNISVGIGRDKFFDILRQEGLLIKSHRHWRVPGTDSKDTKNVYPNLQMKATRAGEVIQSDLTAIRIKDGYKPLAICMDVYSRKILGWHLGSNWSVGEVIKALYEAEAGNTGRLQGSVHHSDRGSQYGSDEYVQECESQGMRVSMSRKATPTDAAHIERLNRTLKREFNLRKKFDSFEEAYETIYYTVLVYNDLRPHWSLGLKTPSAIYGGEKPHIKLTPSGLRPTGVSLM